MFSVYYSIITIKEDNKMKTMENKVKTFGMKQVNAIKRSEQMKAAKRLGISLKTLRNKLAAAKKK